MMPRDAYKDVTLPQAGRIARSGLWGQGRGTERIGCKDVKCTPPAGRMGGREEEGYLPSLINSGNSLWGGGGDVCGGGQGVLLYWKMGHWGCQETKEASIPL